MTFTAIRSSVSFESSNRRWKFCSDIPQELQYHYISLMNALTAVMTPLHRVKIWSTICLVTSEIAGLSIEFLPRLGQNLPIQLRPTVRLSVRFHSNF